MTKDNNPINHPSHYTAHPSGIECIRITEHMGFNLGNAVKYIWRCDLKKDAVEDLKKALWYIQREIDKRVCLSTKFELTDAIEPESELEFFTWVGNPNIRLHCFNSTRGIGSISGNPGHEAVYHPDNGVTVNLGRSASLEEAKQLLITYYQKCNSFTWTSDEKAPDMLFCTHNNVQIGHIDCFNGFYPYVLGKSSGAYPKGNAKTLEKAKTIVEQEYLRSIV